MDRPDWPHFADAMITYRGGAAQGPRAVRASALGGPGAGYIRPCSGTGASLGVGRRTAEVAPGCGSTSRGPEAGLLSCLQGPAFQTKWPAAPRTELAPGCRDSTPRGLRSARTSAPEPVARCSEDRAPSRLRLHIPNRAARTRDPRLRVLPPRGQSRDRRDSDACTALLRWRQGPLRCTQWRSCRCVWPRRRTRKS